MNTDIIESKPSLPSMIENESAPPVAVGAGNQLIAMAMERGMSVEVIEKLLDQKMRFEADEARKAFAVAMSAFKKNPPAVYKDKANTQYNNSAYVSIENLVNTVNKGLADHDLNARWDIETNGIITVTCILSHAQGHSEKVSLSAPPDSSGQKNPIQQIKSTVTYLKIVTFESVTGTASEVGSASASNNDDGNSYGTESLTEDQALTIESRIAENNLNGYALMREFRFESWDQDKPGDVAKINKRIDTILKGRRS